MHPVIAFEVDHDVIAALVGALAIVLVAVVGIRSGRTDRKVGGGGNGEPNLAQKLDGVIELVIESGERRAREHQEIMDSLKDDLARSRWKGEN